MKCKGNKKSKRVKLSLKYNIQKRVRETKRRVKKEAKKLGVKKRVRKDPGIPNSWPFKADMLASVERQKEQREKELAEKRQQARDEFRKQREESQAESKQAMAEREAERKETKRAEAEKRQQVAMARALGKAEVLLVALDARDPLGCRCAAVEAWAQEQGRRLVFVLTKSDLVPPQVAVQWLQILGRVAPAAAVQAEAGRQGVRELLQMLGKMAAPAAAGAGGQGGHVLPKVGVVGYPATGKKELIRAIRREVGGPTPWLVETAGRCEAGSVVADVASTLHLALRAAVPPGTLGSPGREPVAVVEHLLSRAADQQSVLRRFRLPAYEGIEGFLKAFAKERNVKSKKGKEAPPDTIARRFLQELTSRPGCIVAPQTPPAAATTGALWAAHAASKDAVEALMLAACKALEAQAAGPSAAALVISPAAGFAGFGPSVDLSTTIALSKEAAEDDDSDDAAESESLSEEEGEEEEGEMDDGEGSEDMVEDEESDEEEDGMEA